MEVSKGVLVAKIKSSVTFSSENLTFVADKLVISDSKVLTLRGNINDPATNAQIGTFNYRNGNDYNTASMVEHRIECPITNEAYISSAAEATSALLSAVSSIEANINDF